MNTNKVQKGFDEGRFNFVGQIGRMFWLSNILVIVSVIAIFWKGLNYGIDFTGGTEVQIRFQQPLESDGQLRKFLEDQNMANAHMQKFGAENEYLIRFETLKGKNDRETNELQKERVQMLTTSIQAAFTTQGPEIRRVDSVGPQVGEQLKRNSILAMFYSLIAILIYIGLRFDYEFAPGAVLCLFHDVIIVMGVFAIVGKEINSQILAAVLTIIGYDINDTIIVYDRIRENIAKHKGVSLIKIINRSTNETLSRTIVTALTTLISCTALVFLAGGVIEDFAFAMAIGVIFGTYSSIYVASPLVIYFEKFKTKKAKTIAA